MMRSIALWVGLASVVAAGCGRARQGPEPSPASEAGGRGPARQGSEAPPASGGGGQGRVWVVVSVNGRPLPEGGQATIEYLPGGGLRLGGPRGQEVEQLLSPRRRKALGNAFEIAGSTAAAITVRTSEKKTNYVVGDRVSDSPPLGEGEDFEITLWRE